MPYWLKKPQIKDKAKHDESSTINDEFDDSEDVNQNNKKESMKNNQIQTNVDKVELNDSQHSFIVQHDNASFPVSNV